MGVCTVYDENPLFTSLAATSARVHLGTIVSEILTRATEEHSGLNRSKRFDLELHQIRGATWSFERKLKISKALAARAPWCRLIRPEFARFMDQACYSLMNLNPVEVSSLHGLGVDPQDKDAADIVACCKACKMRRHHIIFLPFLTP